MSVNTDADKSLKEVYSQLISAHKENGQAICLSHFGSLSQDLIHSIAMAVEELMVSSGEVKRIVKRSFSILIEGLQNIYRHGSVNEEGIQLAFLIVVRGKDDFKLIFGNLVEESDTEYLRNYIQRLNSMDTDQLKTKYLEVLSNDTLSDKGGAGLGFLTMIMKSDGPLTFDILPLTNIRSGFFVEVSLSRS
ncbi:MAG: hypothetical protein RIT43_2400 [Bacteroidota bacterium]|jgi:hypothetical protein